MNKEWVNRVVTWIVKYGIRAIMFDLDDTLIIGREMFYRRIEESFSYISSHYPDLDISKLRERHSAINTKAFSKFAVQPKRWVYVYAKLSEEYPEVSQEVWDEALKIIFKLYSDIPRVLKGVIEVLNFFKELGVKLILVTHASEEWTEFKLKVTGLKDFFDVVICIDPAAFKTHEAWLRGAQAANVKPCETAAVGDNLRGDIISAYEAGVRQLFWVDSGDGWSIYREGALPDGTKVIKGVYELLDCIANQDGVS